MPRTADSPIDTIDSNMDCISAEISQKWIVDLADQLRDSSKD